LEIIFMNDIAAAATPPVAPAAPTAPATTTTPTVPTPSEAAAKLSALTADGAWTAKLLSADPATVKEFNGLSRQAVSADADLAMAAGVDPGSTEAARIAADLPALRESGLSDGVIKELLAGRESTPAEVDAARRFQNMRHSDESWVARLLKGEHEAVRESRLMSIILMMAPV
jgi:hypothetical protein